MQFSFSMNAFRQYDLTEGVGILADIGYDGVELLFDQPHLFPPEATDGEIERVRKAIEDNGVVVSNCNAFMLSAVERTAKSHAAEYDRETELFHHPSFVEPAAADRRERIEYTEAALRTAATLDAPNVSIQPGGPVPEGVPRERAMEWFVEALQEVTDTAEDVGVDVLVEPEPHLLIETSDQFLDLADRVDSPRLGCNFDAGHFFCVGEDPAELVETLGAYTGHYHLEDIPADRTHEHTQLGEGGMDIDGFLGTLEGVGYDGFVTVELYPYEDTAAETARRAMNYLEERGWV